MATESELQQFMREIQGSHTKRVLVQFLKKLGLHSARKLDKRLRYGR